MAQQRGRTIGHYQIGPELGRGGMAVVYKAWQPSLGRYVALKVLPAYFAHDREFLQRFYREARAAAGLDHPNIIKIYDTAEADGVHYIAMEYLEGGSLLDRLSAGPLTLGEAQRIVSQVAAGLDHAHARGLIHRDIKPSNVLFGADGMAKIADFGIARATEGTQLTKSGVLLGTPGYMAPEQATGVTVDRRADLYALGVVLYQMLTGQAPFRGTTPHAIMHAVIYEPPPPPRQLNPRLPTAVETVILRALAKDPAQRFQSGTELVGALKRAREGKGVTVPSPAKPRRTSRSRLLPYVLMLAAAAMIMVLLGGFLLWQQLGPAGSPTTAEPDVRATEVAMAAAYAAATQTAQALSPADNSGRTSATEEALRLTAAAGTTVAETDTARATNDSSGWATAQMVTQTAQAATATAEAEYLSAEATQTAAALATELAVVQATQTALAQPSATDVPEPTPTEPPTNTPEPTEPETPARDMIAIPAGEFAMGSNDRPEDGPPHAVYLNAFSIDRTEVSNAQYNQCVQAGACGAPTSCWFGSPTLGTGQPDHPVGCITWYDALDYCSWAGARLPTEAEWEKAARGSDGRSYPWGNSAPDCGKAQSRDCGPQSVPVSSNPAGASPYGVLNMAGNVWEWTQDWHKDGYYSESPYENPTGGGPGSGKMVRGGSWDAGADELRCTFRSAIQPDYTGSDLGFRCARD